MHSAGKGISKSSLPYKRSPPSWLKISAQEVTEHVCKLAKKGLTPSQVRRRQERGNGLVHEASRRLLLHDVDVHTTGLAARYCCCRYTKLV